MLPHSRLMIHDPLIAGKGITGSAILLSERVEDLMKTRELIAGLMAKHTGRTMEEIYEKTAKDTWFTAEEAIAFGLADKVIQSEK